jgi:sodium-dependent dicarboxylate transporter 2/3/5
MVKIWEPEATHEARAPFLVRHHYTLLVLFLAMSSLIAFGPRPDGLSVSGQRVIGIFALCIGLWVSGAIPLQITSILAIILLPLLRVMPSGEAFALFGNNAVFFILGAFILSAALIDCGLSTRISCAVLGLSSTSAVRLRTTILFLSAFASFWMSEHAVAAMLFPVVLSLVRAMGLRPRQSRFGMSFFFALAWGCVIGGIATYLGGARNPLAVGILFAQSGRQISFLRWLTASLPMVLMMLALAWLVLKVFFKVEPVDMTAARHALHEERRKLGAVTPKERGVAVLSALTIMAWVLLANLVGLATIALLSVVLMFVFRLTRWDLIENTVNWGIILMYGGAIALGSALHTSGAADWLVRRALGDAALSPFMLLILLGALSLLLTEFISNAAVVSMLMPVGLGLGQAHGIPLEAVTLAVALPSGLSFVLPMGTPATAIAYSSGFMTQREFIKLGLLMNILSILCFALVAYWYWPRIGL